MMTFDITITTKSNIYIGGMPHGFEIGGIDMTTTTRDDKPYIPASSFKGALREVCYDSPNEEIDAIFNEYPEPNKEKDPKAGGKHLYIFGIIGYNRSPKLIFTDLHLAPLNQPDPFSIDMKNSITDEGTDLVSNPRTYKTARAGLIFEGAMHFDFGKDNKIVEKYLREMTAKFSEGIYRIGNSKSRGYGWITVNIK